MDLNKKLIKADVVDVKVKDKTSQLILNPFNSGIILWNNRLPFYVTKKGTIKKYNYENILDTLRECYGIDLTKDIKVTKSDILDRVKYLKDRISDLKKSDLSKKLNENILEKYKKELATIKNRNTTYNLYYLRKKSFNTKGIEKLLASFLIITGQVIYKKGKYKFYDNVGRYFKVLKPKSYDKDNIFFQKVFKKVFKIESADRKKMNNGLSEYIIKNPNILKITSIEYNLMYSFVMYNKIKKMASLLKDNDTMLILKSLYEYKDALNNIREEEDNKYLNNSINKIKESFNLRGEGKIKQSNLLFKRTMNTKFLKVLKNNWDVNIEVLIDVLSPYFILTSKYNKDIFKLKQSIKENYYSKEEVDKKYISREEVERCYVKKNVK